jgi:transposase
MSDPNTTRFVGLDVHKDTIAIAVAAPGQADAKILATLPHDFASLSKSLARLGPADSLSCCYEAGPTGFGLARQLEAAGYHCLVIAPSLVPVKAGCRIKTDRRDAAKLAHFLRSGDLVKIHIPDEATEAIRDLARSRDAAKRAERVARQQLSKFLLRHGRVYSGKTSWNEPHRGWMAKQEFTQPAQKRVLADGLAAVEQATARVRRLTNDLGELSASWSLAPLVVALQAMRGIEMVSAVTIVSEIGDFGRFATAGDLMGFVGLIPSEHTTGNSRRQGPITKTGNQHVRRILVESAWHYRRLPRMSKAIRARNELVSSGVREIAWKAQMRLSKRMSKLLGRGKPPGQVVIAVARELAGFVWAIARQEVLLAS